MISMQEASEKLLEMFKSQEFGPQLALTIIRRRADDPVNALPCNKWSIGNHILMWFFGRTDAAATYLQWKNMNRRVVKNAKAFPIFSPVTAKVKKKKDDGTEEERLIVKGFRPVPVEDTIGVDLKTSDYTPPEMPPLYKAAEMLGVKVYWRPMSQAAYGYYRPGDNSITLSNGKYLLRVETPADDDGIKHTKNRTVEAKDWNDAERQLRKLISEVAKEKPATKKQRDNRRMSVSELLDRYIAAKELEGKSVTTLDKYRNYRRRIDEAFNGRTIADLTVTRIDKFSQNLSGATNRHDEVRANKGKAENSQIRDISQDYKYQIQSLLLRAIKWADKKGYLTDNVTHRVTKLPKGEYEQIEIPDIEEIIKFIDYLTV